MSIKATGMIGLYNELYVDSPLLEIIPTLDYKGKLQVRVSISGLNNQFKYYDNMDKSILTSTLTNPYDAMIDAIQNIVLEDLIIQYPNIQFNIQ